MMKYRRILLLFLCRRVSAKRRTVPGSIQNCPSVTKINNWAFRKKNFFYAIKDIIIKQKNNVCRHFGHNFVRTRSRLFLNGFIFDVHLLELFSKFLKFGWFLRIMLIYLLMMVCIDKNSAIPDRFRFPLARKKNIPYIGGVPFGVIFEMSRFVFY